VATLFIVLPFYFVLRIAWFKAAPKLVWRLTLVWSRLWLRLVGMKVGIEGALPKGTKYVVIANHVSYLDPIAIYDVLPFYFRPLAKHDLAQIPILGSVYAQIAILVDRSSAHTRATSMLQMQHLLQNECSIFIYPEGTFNETSAPLHHFYDGAFKLAIETQTAILPIIFPDTRARWHYEAWWKLWPGRNRAYVMAPIEVQGMTKADIAALKNDTWQQMNKHMKQFL
jgi:1-acyl-sn-glycerol-3-phosphate acyltransferase